jgi:hypothetical protein
MAPSQLLAPNGRPFAPRVDEPPLSRSGRAHFNGLLEIDELLMELAGTNGLRIFDEMYFSDPDIRRLVLMSWTPVQAGTWDIEPYGGEDATAQDLEAAEFCRWALWEVMSPNLIGHLGEVGPALLRAGFVPFEQMWMSIDWKGRRRIVPRKLGFMLPRTIYNWNQDEYGELTEIVQLLPGRPARVPASDLVYYRLNAEGDNWMGRSLLRPAYKPWFFKDRLEKIDAIGQERKAVGLPVAYPPSGADEDQRASVEAVLANVHTNEAGYIIMPGPSAEWNKDDPNAWYVDVVRFDSSSGTGIKDSLAYHRDAISSSYIGDFMRLGQDGVGARSLGEVQDNPFLTVVRALGTSIVAETLNKQLIAPLAGINFPNLEGFPRLTLSLHDDASLDELATFARKLHDAGMLQADPELEDYFRDRADFPPANKDIREQRERAAEAAREQLATGPDPAAPDDPAGDGRDPRAPAAPAPPAHRPGDARPDPRGGRQLDHHQETDLRTLVAALDPERLRWWERMLALDHLVEALDGARDRFDMAGTAHLIPIARDMAQRAAAGKTMTRPNMGPLVDALAAELEQLDQVGYDTVIRELRDQHGRLGTMPTVQLADAGDEAAAGAGGARAREEAARRRRLRKRAELAARNVVEEARKAVERAAIGGAAVGRGMSGRDAARLQQVGERAGRDALRMEGRINSAGAINGGRAAAARVHDGDIVGAYYTAVLDERTCTYCQIADDGIVRPIDDPILQATMPPNPECEGGDFCRCMLAYVLADDPAALGYG